MGISLKKITGSIGNFLGGVERQINPFDNGATYSNPTPAPRPAQPNAPRAQNVWANPSVQTTPFTGVSQPHTQVSPLIKDVQERSMLDMGNHNDPVGNFLTETAKGIVKPLVQFPLNVSNQIYNHAVAPAFGLPKQDLKTNPLGVGPAANWSGADGSLHQTIGSGLQTALTIGTGGTAGLLEKGATKIVPNAAPALIKALAPKVAADGILGGAFGATQGIGDNHSVKDILTKDVPVNAAVGAALPVVGKALKGKNIGLSMKDVSKDVPKPDTHTAYGKTIEMTPQNGYTPRPTADGGVVYQKVAKTGSNVKGTQLTSEYYGADGTKLTTPQALATIKGEMASAKPKVSEKVTPSPVDQQITDIKAKEQVGYTVDQNGVAKPKVSAKSPSTELSPSIENVKAPVTEKVPSKAQLRKNIEGENLTTGKLTDNKTYLRVKNDKTVPTKVKRLVKAMVHDVQDDGMAAKAAHDIVKYDTKTAERLYGSSKFMAENQAVHTKIGDALASHYLKRGDIDAAAQVLDVRITKGTELGRGLRSLRGTDPNLIVRVAEKQASKRGIVFKPAERVRFYDKAAEISKMKSGKAKDQALSDLKDEVIVHSFGEKMANIAAGTLSLPRTFMTSADLSFGLRQGAVLGARHPITWGKAFGIGARAAIDPKYGQRVLESIRTMKDVSGAPMAPTLQRMKVDIPALRGQSEEIFGNTSVAEGKIAKKLLFGHIVAASDRAFSTSAAVLRSYVTRDFVNNMGGAKALEKSFISEKHYTDYGRVINTATGRGQGGKTFEGIAPYLGNTLFSARLWKSRLDMMNPVYYAKLTPAARKEAVQSMLAFTSLVGATLMAAHVAGLGVETDARSTDFLKIKIGNTRHDILGGFQPNMVALWRGISRESKSTNGTITKIDNKGYDKSHLTLIADLFTNKLAPVPGTAIKMYDGLTTGKDKGGNTFNPWTELGKLLIPMNVPEANSQYSDARQHGASKVGAAVHTAIQSTPGVFGIGTDTFEAKPAVKPGSVDPSTLSPKDLVKYSGAVTEDFKSKLSPEDQKLFDINGNRQAATLALRSGKVTQDQLDGMTVRFNQAKDKAGLPIDYVGGFTNDDFKAASPSGRALIKDLSIHGLTKYEDPSKPVSPIAKTVMSEAMKDSWPGIGDITPTNKLAVDYAKMDKAIRNAPGDQAAELEAKRTYWKGAVKAQYSDAVAKMYEDNNDSTTNQTSKGYGYSIADIKRLASGVTMNGKSYKLTDTDLNSMVSLDNRLLESGLIDSPKFTNKTRAALGFGDAPSTKQGVGYKDGSAGGGSSKQGYNPNEHYFSSEGLRIDNNSSGPSRSFSLSPKIKTRVASKSVAKKTVTMKKKARA